MESGVDSTVRTMGIHLTKLAGKFEQLSNVP